jgi:hypothetical protein
MAKAPTKAELYAHCATIIREHDDYPSVIKRSAPYKALRKAFYLPGEPFIGDDIIASAVAYVAYEYLADTEWKLVKATSLEDAANRLLFFTECRYIKKFPQFVRTLGSREALHKMAMDVIAMAGRLDAHEAPPESGEDIGEVLL